MKQIGHRTAIAHFSFNRTDPTMEKLIFAELVYWPREHPERVKRKRAFGSITKTYLSIQSVSFFYSAGTAIPSPTFIFLNTSIS